MLKGLEISVVNYSDASSHTVSSRIDSEFFKKEYLEDDSAIAKNGFEKLSNITNKIDVGYVGAMVQHYQEEGVSLLQTKDVKTFFISDNVKVKIAPNFHKELEKSQVHFKDILIARSGSFGKASIYLEEEIINSSDIIIVEANYNRINPFFLVSFLNSKFGVNQMIRFSSGGLQGHVNLTILEELEVPNIDKKFQNTIEDVVVLSYSKRKEAVKFNEEAKETMLQRVDLLNFESKKTDNHQEINLSKSFSSTTRLDAEYYHPKPLFLIDQLKQKEYHLVKDLFNIGNGYAWKSKYFKESGEGEPFVRIRNCKPGYIDNETLTTLDSEYANSEGVDKAQKDDIVIGMDGIKYFYGSLIKEPVYVNQRVCHLTPKEDSEIDSELVLMIINSVIGQTQLMREMTIAQTVGHITNTSVGNLIIPKLDKDVRNEISSKIKESHQLEKESLHLLEVAKRAVEIAIEENEEKALEFIKREIKE